MYIHVFVNIYTFICIQINKYIYIGGIIIYILIYVFIFYRNILYGDEKTMRIDSDGIQSTIKWLTFSTPYEAVPSAANGVLCNDLAIVKQLMAKAETVEVDGGIDFSDFLKVMHHYREYDIMYSLS